MLCVAGYNLDIFRNQNERPYTSDGSVNLAHLLVGSEGTLAFTKSLKLQLTELPKAKVLGSGTGAIPNSPMAKPFGEPLGAEMVIESSEAPGVVS